MDSGPVPLSCPMDESSDQKRQDVFVAVALVSAIQCWATIESSWGQRLRQADIKYFRSTECASLSGQFRKFRDAKLFPPPLGRQTADKVRDDLEAIITSAPLAAFAVGILISDYRETLRDVPGAKVFFPDDPHTEAYNSLMLQVARVVRRKVPGFGVAYEYDSSKKISGQFQKVAHSYNAAKRNHPPIAQSMVSLVPLDDTNHPPLQAADLIAHVMKDAFIGWLKNGRPNRMLFDSKWAHVIEFIGFWDRAYIQRVTEKNLRSRKFAKNLLPMRPRYEKDSRNTIEKCRRRALKNAWLSTHRK